MRNSMLGAAFFANPRRGRARLLLAALPVAPVLATSPALVGCSDQTTDDGSIRGTLNVYVATMADGTSHTEYRLLLDSDTGEERKLVFAREPDAGAGAEIKVWGELTESQIIVE